MVKSPPAYRQMEAFLRELLPTLEEGALLPTLNELNARFGTTGVQTGRDAYAPLIAEGWVEVHERGRRRHVLVKVPEATPEPCTDTVILDRITAVETSLRQALRDLAAISADLGRRAESSAPAPVAC